MAMRRVAGHVSQRLLKGREEVRNYFTDPFVLKVKDALKYEAQIVKREDYLQQKLEELKYEFWRHQKLSAEYKAKHGAAIKFQVFIVGSALAAFVYDISQKHAYVEAMYPQKTWADCYKP
ncbi:hypothetical protein MKW94_026805 [Papaver nudicaule]|uniref:Uncharacterized protein n=1 Tax=Papaver nudicaule TaxID=74823 RepID=A0AA41RYI2_PAPNU|nr:hypothetical protein [Papaver nudicaule]MCL7032322.1 hypothetical protein [Papaver nudicaule]